MKKVALYHRNDWHYMAGICNYSGTEFTTGHLSRLNEAACTLIDSFPSTYQDSFLVLDYGFYFHNQATASRVDEIWQEVIARADSISPYYLLFGRVPGDEGEVKVELKMPMSLFDCYESSYIARIHFEIKRRVQDQPIVTGQIEAMNYLTGEVRRAKVCCEGTTNLKSECVTCSWTLEAVNAFLDLEGFDQEVAIETDGEVLPADDCVCETEPADVYQEACVGSNCVAKQVGIAEFEVYLNSYPVDTLYHELQRIAGYFDSLGVAFYASITDYRMFCVEGASSAFKSQSGNKDLLHFQSAFDAAEVAFWFHLAEVDGEERLLIRQKGFEGDVLDCCCELIPGDCRSNPVPVCEFMNELYDHYAVICDSKRFNIKLAIYNGLNGEFGGDIVDDPINIGAVTVANKNDTDGDGIIDNEDDIVEESTTGRDEVDLMQLDITYSGRNRRGIEEVDLVLEGDIKLWEKSTKEVQAELTYSLTELPKTVYVEALTESQTLQDISIKAIANDKEYAEVKATAIWVKKVSKTVSGKVPYPNSVVGQSLASTIKFSKDEMGNYYGTGKYNILGHNGEEKEAIGGRILLEYQLFPPEANSLGLYLDITRRLEEVENGRMTSGTNTFIDERDDFFQDQVEKPNDDTLNLDEDIFTSFPRLFSYDAPSGFVTHNSGVGENVASYKVWEGHFEEFVRVSFNPINYAQEQQEVGPILGTRCSDTIQWQHRRLLKITSNNTEDPYNPLNLVYEQVTQEYTVSTPNIFVGTGRGEITISLNSSGTTKGYRIFFTSDTEVVLYEFENQYQLIDSASLINDRWDLEGNDFHLIIQNDSNYPYVAGDELFFSTLSISNFETLVK
jgi:hypothetical protein